MPRVRRKPKVLRGVEAPLVEWSLGELKAELERLENHPGDFNVWQAFKRKSELGNELFKRTGRDE